MSRSAAQARRRAINPHGDEYPDDDSTKGIVLEAEDLELANHNDRHVLLRWTNGSYYSLKLSISLADQATIIFTHPKSRFIPKIPYLRTPFTRSASTPGRSVTKSLPLRTPSQARSTREQVPDLDAPLVRSHGQ
jgi:hypothetical protein